MVIEYLHVGFGKSNLSKNNIEWTLERILTKRNNLITFCSKSRTRGHSKGICEEKEFITEVINRAYEYLTLREKDTRTQNLNEMIEKFHQLKQLNKE
ncbi:hypothetical protein ACIQ6U_21890 [Lysinibacillus fusiformis]|uniref:hypothetical protein n=1 Tax=Lysinibacillus fusiformis TaxID=28031 RepID=UPI0038150989